MFSNHRSQSAGSMMPDKNPPDACHAKVSVIGAKTLEVGVSPRYLVRGFCVPRFQSWSTGTSKLLACCFYFLCFLLVDGAKTRAIDEFVGDS